MLDINEVVVNKYTKDYVLSKLGHNTIFMQFYAKNIEIGIKVSSPFREDNDPSFVIYERTNGLLFFMDFATGLKGDAFTFVKTLYDCSFIESLKIILNEFGLESHGDYKPNPKVLNKIIKKTYDRTKIGINARKVKNHDREFWAKFGITGSTLNKFGVKPVSTIYSKSNVFKAEKHAYAFGELMGADYYLKIYQPYGNPKWISSMPAKVIFGWRMLPDTGELLIITKALKEVMSIYETLEIPSVAIQSETIIIKESVLNELKTRFKRIVGLFDNDNQGKIIASKYEELGIPQIFIKDYKNYTDRIEEDSLENAKKELINLLNFK